MTTSGSIEHGRREISLQLVIGALLMFAGAASILRLSNLWSLTDLRYAEYSVVLLLGALCVAGALRTRR